MSKSLKATKKDNRFQSENSSFRISVNGGIYPKKPKHKNYLLDLRKSNVLKKEKEWENVINDKGLDRVKKYHKMRMNLAKQDALLTQKEKLVHFKAKENGKSTLC